MRRYSILEYATGSQTSRLTEAALSASNSRLVEVVEHMDVISEFLPDPDNDPGHVVFQIREACHLELARRFGSPDTSLDLVKATLARPDASSRYC